MAGWRKVAGEGGDAPTPVELLDAEDPSEVAVAGGRSVDWHAAIRTAAAVVAALSLLWIGRSYADQATNDDQMSCINDVQSAFWRYEQTGFDSRTGRPTIDAAVLDDLVVAARDCGSDAYADALERTRPTDDDDS